MRQWSRIEWWIRRPLLLSQASRMSKKRNPRGQKAPRAAEENPRGRKMGGPSSPPGRSQRLTSDHPTTKTKILGPKKGKEVVQTIKLPHNLQIRPGAMSADAHCIKFLAMTSVTVVLSRSRWRIIMMGKVQCLSHQKIADHQRSKEMTRIRKCHSKGRITTSTSFTGVQPPTPLNGSTRRHGGTSTALKSHLVVRNTPNGQRPP